MKQMEMPFMQNISKLVLLPHELIQRCETDQQAIQLCFEQRKNRGYTQRRVAEMIGMDAGNFSRALHKGPFPSDKRGRLMTVCGNLAPTQFETWKRGVPLVSEQRLQELEMKLAELRGAA